MKHKAILSCLLSLTTSLAAAEEAPSVQAAVPRSERPVITESYVAGLGEIMGATQMRHAKLWFAGNAGNWGLADYELNEIEEGFEDAAKFHPTLKEIPVAELLSSFTSQPLTDVKSAIESRDPEHFTKAFEELTAACNACHQVAKRGFIVITTPSAAPVSNQAFVADSL